MAKCEACGQQKPVVTRQDYEDLAVVLNTAPVDFSNVHIEDAGEGLQAWFETDADGDNDSPYWLEYNEEDRQWRIAS